MKTQELITTGRAAEILGLTPSYVCDLVAAGRLPIATTVETGGRPINLLDRVTVERFGRTPRPKTGRPPKPKPKPPAE